jgi:hypothetical protein
MVARDPALTVIVSAKTRVSEVLEAVPDELSRSLAGQTPAPVTTEDPVAELGLPFDRTLVTALRRLQDPPADELTVDQSHPEAQARHGLGGRQTAVVVVLDLLAGARLPVTQVAHHLGIRVELDLVLEVFVGQRHQQDAAGPKRGL